MSGAKRRIDPIPDLMSDDPVGTSYADVTRMYGERYRWYALTLRDLRNLGNLRNHTTSRHADDQSIQGAKCTRCGKVFAEPTSTS